MDTQVGRAPSARAPALELRDTLAATLFALRAALERLAEEPTLDPAARARLADVKGQLRDTAAAVRGFCTTLSAAPQDAALAAALREQCRAVSEHGVEAVAVILTDLPPMPRASIDIVTEAVRACLLHAQRRDRARFVAVSAFAVRGGVGVAVCDDGPGPADGERTGLDTEQLAALMARAGGTVCSGPGDDGGLVVRLWIPA